MDNFKFEIIEQCKCSELDEKERFWIKKLDTYNNGYNGTMGGSGSITVDRDDFEEYFLNNKPSVKELADKFKIDRSTAGRILKKLGYKANYYVSDERKKQICDFYLSDP